MHNAKTRSSKSARKGHNELDRVPVKYDRLSAADRRQPQRHPNSLQDGPQDSRAKCHTIYESRIMQDKVTLANAALIALGKTLDKWGDRDALPDGSRYDVNATIEGDIDGAAFSLPVKTRLTIGHTTERATSSTPRLNEVVGSLLGAIAVVCDEATAQACCNELLQSFGSNGKIGADEQFADMAEHLLAGLRQQKQITARGAVKAAPEAKQAQLDFSEKVA